jgi:hypothetical protein
VKRFEVDSSDVDEVDSLIICGADRIRPVSMKIREQYLIHYVFRIFDLNKNAQPSRSTVTRFGVLLTMKTTVPLDLMCEMEMIDGVRFRP